MVEPPVTEGVVDRSGASITIRFERRLHHPVGVVWRALTDPDEAGAWFGGRVEIDLRDGGHYITHHATGDRVVDRITRLDPPRLLEHTFWEHLNPDARVTYELEASPEGCLLVLVHRLSVDDLTRAADTYGWDDPMAQVPRTTAGWHRLLDRLEAGLDGTEPVDPGPDLLERYTAQLG
jgi:uncharacterized protein YndB with AHSA1/START domain